MPQLLEPLIYVLACLACNGPLGKPGGGVFMRYATLAFEWYGI